MKKGILIKDQLIQMTFDETYKQFERFRYKIFRYWRDKLPLKIENEDISQEINIGLWDAYKGYDASKGAAFITYATLIINSIFWHMCRDINVKKRKASLTLESLNATAKQTDLKTEIIDIIEDDSFEDNLILKIRIEESIKTLNERDKVIIKMLTTGSTQAEIARYLGASQAHVSRLSKRLRKTLSIELEDICV